MSVGTHVSVSIYVNVSMSAGLSVNVRFTAGISVSVDEGGDVTTGVRLFTWYNS